MFGDDALLIDESKEDIEKFKQWAGEDLYNRFLKQKDRLRSKDIYYWMKQGKNSLDIALQTLEKSPTRKEIDKNASKGAQKIYEDDKWLVLKITSFEASIKYGKGTSWCITGNNTYDGKDDFDDYNKSSNIYFFIRKGTNEKYALIIRKDDSEWKLWDEVDFIEVQSNSDFPEDEWNPYDTGGRHLDFPKIKGLPDLNKAYEKRAKELGYDKELVLEEFIELKPIDRSKEIVKLPSFTKQFKEIGLDDKDFEKLKEKLYENAPETNLGNNVYKFRWYYRGRKTKDARVIYIDFINDTKTYLVSIYTKDEKDNLSPQEERKLKKLSDKLKSFLDKK